MLKHILVATDGSASSRHAARFALSMARQARAQVTLLTVLPPPEALPLGPLSGYAVMAPPISRDEAQHALAMLDEIASEFPDLEVKKKVEAGSAAETIVDGAHRFNADMIVMGARGLNAAERFLLGSISDRVVRNAHCPVTIWR